MKTSGEWGWSPCINDVWSWKPLLIVESNSLINWGVLSELLYLLTLITGLSAQEEESLWWSPRASSVPGQTNASFPWRYSFPAQKENTDCGQTASSSWCYLFNEFLSGRLRWTWSWKSSFSNSISSFQWCLVFFSAAAERKADRSTSHYLWPFVHYFFLWWTAALTGRAAVSCIPALKAGIFSFISLIRLRWEYFITPAHGLIKRSHISVCSR